VHGGDPTVDPSQRLKALRSVLAEHGLAAYLVPHADQHQNEYLTPRNERLAWISGFSGSAGLAVVGLEAAALFVDGRYTLQARDQADPKHWQHLHITTDPVELWLKRHVSAGDAVGFDPRLHTPGGLARLRTVLENSGITLKAVDGNLIDPVWTDRPEQAPAPVTIYDLTFAGEASRDKRQRMADALTEDGLDAVVISAPDNLAWLFNIRGADVDMTPSVFAYAILKSDARAALFIDKAKLGADVRAEIEAQGEGAVTVFDPDQFAGALTDLGDLGVRVDSATANVFIVDTLTAVGAKVDVGADPCTLAKARKNPVELQGIRNAHVRDGVALARFFNWFAQTQPGQETEWTAAQKIDGLRAEGEHYRSLSFPTISGAGENGAIVHYKVEQATARSLGPDEM